MQRVGMWRSRRGAAALVALVALAAALFTLSRGDEASATKDMADYAPFVSATMEVFAGLRASRAGATAEEVAAVIFEAATDGKDQIRSVATDAIRPMV